MSKENEPLGKHENGNDSIADVGDCVSYSATHKIRYKSKEIDLGNGTAKVEYRLQQMWQGSDGSEIWEWIEYVD